MMKIIVRISLYGEFYSGYCVSSLNAVPIDQETINILSYASTLKCTSVHVETSAYFLLPFLKELHHGDAFRKNLVFNTWAKLNRPSCRIIYLNIDLKPPDQEIIDYLWNERMLRFVWSRVEVENALSWLSTLGGAFSALGDYFDHCAEMAGKISIRQLQLSVMLGDEGLAARSRLYSSLAIAQRGNLRLARKVVRSVAEFARTSKDRRLMRMCLGVWAKLRYLRALEVATKANDKGDVTKAHRKEVNSQRDVAA